MEESSFPIAVFTPVIFLIVFPLFWSLICVIIAFFGGWQRLARHFATTRELTGDEFHMRSGRFGMSNYRSVLTIVVSYEGIWIRPIIFFRAGHKPLLIPWDAIASIEFGTFILTKSTTLLVQPHDGSKPTRIQLYSGTLGDSIRRHGPSKFDFEEAYQ